jgi:hypothetical protein
VSAAEQAPPTNTGADWNLDAIVRGLAASLHKRGLMERPDEKSVSRLTVALAEAFGTTDLGELARRVAPPVQRLNSSDQCVALVQAGRPYGCGFGAQYSTHRESDVIEGLNAGGYEIVRVAK